VEKQKEISFFCINIFLVLLLISSLSKSLYTLLQVLHHRSTLRIFTNGTAASESDENERRKKEGSTKKKGRTHEKKERSY